MDGHKWFDEWKLSITGYSDGMAHIDIELPHNPDMPEVTIWTTKESMGPLANVLDKAFSELTGTKVTEVITDGSNPPAPFG